VSLPALKRLKADNFLQGNIIFEIAVFNSDFPISSVRRAFGLEDEIDPPWLAQQMTEMNKYNWTLFELSSSYGCDLVAIAQGKMRVERIE
jgi:hypothetical protein